jgi:anthranilate phosphoribosyltransferase
MTSEVLKPLITTLAAGHRLNGVQAEAAVLDMMEGRAEPAQIAAFLTALHMRGETAEEIAGAARAMRAKMVTIEAPPGALDCCGTGGDHAGTYNVSTAVSFVVAACGVPMAKHGNRAASSRSGAADVLGALGVNVAAPLAAMQRGLFEANICFLFAPNHHPAMKYVGPVRSLLGFRTIFNLLGPLSNPAGAKRQLMGVFAKEWVEPMAQVLNALGAEKAWVVHGADGLDEITTTGETHVAILENGHVTTRTVSPADFGLAVASPAALKGGSAMENAAALQAVLEGAPGSYRDIVLANAAAALLIAEKAESLKAGVALAAEAIDSGRAKRILARLIEITNAPEAGV